MPPMPSHILSFSDPCSHQSHPGPRCRPPTSTRLPWPLPGPFSTCLVLCLICGVKGGRSHLDSKALSPPGPVPPSPPSPGWSPVVENGTTSPIHVHAGQPPASDSCLPTSLSLPPPAKTSFTIKEEIKATDQTYFNFPYLPPPPPRQSLLRAMGKHEPYCTCEQDLLPPASSQVWSAVLRAQGPPRCSPETPCSSKPTALCLLDLPPLCSAFHICSLSSAVPVGLSFP